MGYDGVQQTFKDYFKFKEDNIYFLMKLCKDKVIWKIMLNTLIYTLHSTGHLFFCSYLKRFCKENVLYYTARTFTVSLYSEPLLMLVLFCKHLNVVIFVQVHSEVDMLFRQRRHCNE